MSLEQTIQELATIAAMAEADDAPRLVALRDGLHALATAESGQEQTSNVARTTADLVEKIVLRDCEDVDDALAQIHEAIDYLQAVAESVSAGASADQLTLPRIVNPDAARGSADAGSRDAELVGLWIGSASLALNELEEHILNLETEQGDGVRAETLATIKRGLHTLKGECGVLAAHHAQALCHEAETAIGHALDRGLPFPTDHALALLDWMRGWAEQLATDPDAPTPPHADLLERLQQFAAGAEEQAQANAAAAPAAPAADAPGADEPVDLAAEDDEMLAEFMAEAREHLDAAEAAALELENNAEDIELINTIFRAFHTI
ncbi:MAG: Hpt domain-containing protein, partial [Phycisphaerales bacterium]|nr:Hpt domain-containing protein [Phycisphaerales bacterium]